MLASKVAAGLGLSYQQVSTDKVSSDDLVGFPNPQSIARGELSYIPTGTALWKVQFALLDEIARANPVAQSKFNEVLWGRTLMGLPTELQHVWAAMNPAGQDYHAHPLDLALLSRFTFMVSPPTLDTMPDSIARRVVGSWYKREKREGCIDAARAWLIDTLTRARQLVSEIVRVHGELATSYLLNLRHTLLAQSPEDATRLDGRSFDTLHMALMHHRALLETVGEGGKDISAQVKSLIGCAFPLLRLKDGKVTPFPFDVPHDLAWNATMSRGPVATLAAARIGAQTAPLAQAAQGLTQGARPIDSQSTGVFIHRLEATLTDQEADPEEHAEALIALDVALEHISTQRWPEDVVTTLTELEGRFFRVDFGPTFEVADGLGISLAAMNSDRPLLLALTFLAAQIAVSDGTRSRRAPPGAYRNALGAMAHRRSHWRARLGRLVSALRQRLAQNRLASTPPGEPKPDNGGTA